jgi:hypothetical protein
MHMEILMPDMSSGCGCRRFVRSIVFEVLEQLDNYTEIKHAKLIFTHQICVEASIVVVPDDICPVNVRNASPLDPDYRV